MHTLHAEFRQVILLGDRLDIRRSLPAHLVIRDLPCTKLAFRRHACGLVVEATDGIVEESQGRLPGQTPQ